MIPDKLPTVGKPPMRSSRAWPDITKAFRTQDAPLVALLRRRNIYCFSQSFSGRILGGIYNLIAIWA